MKEEEAPEVLEDVWDDEVRESFKKLSPKRQNFLIAYLETGVSAEAYRRAYNPNAGDHLAAVHGSRLVSTSDIRMILNKFGDRKADALGLVVKTYYEMAQAKRETDEGEKPDWKARKDGADGLSRIFGLNSPEKVEDDRFTALLEHMKQTRES